MYEVVVSQDGADPVEIVPYLEWDKAQNGFADTVKRYRHGYGKGELFHVSLVEVKATETVMSKD